MTKTFDQRAQTIRLLVLDVDGVLTDGSLTFTGEGELSKTFNVRDGLGIKLLQEPALKWLFSRGEPHQSSRIARMSSA